MPADPALLPRTADVAIIGGGIAGLSTALFLARAGAEVVVLERGQPWGEASGANAGTLSVQVKIMPVLTLARKAVAVWRDLGEILGRDLGFAQPGGIRVATSPALAEELRRYADRQRQMGLDTDWLEGAALRDAAPWLGPTVIAATLCADDAFTIPLLAGPALIEGVRRLSGRIRGETPVVGMARAGSGFRLGTPAGDLDCKTLVIAAGGDTSRLGRMLEIDLPLFIDVNMLSVTEPAPPTLDRVITHIGGVLSLKQQPNGSILIGGGWQGRGSFQSGTREIDHERYVHNLRTAAAVVPALKGLRIVRAWAGFEAVTGDAVPLLGPLPGCPGAYVAAGARGGYHLGPIQGLLLSELITGRTPTLAIDAFDPGRAAAAGAP